MSGLRARVALSFFARGKSAAPRQTAPRRTTREEFQTLFASELAGLANPAPTLVQRRHPEGAETDPADVPILRRALTRSEAQQIAELEALRHALHGLDRRTKAG